jgi:hypothetical protein
VSIKSFLALLKSLILRIATWAFFGVKKGRLLEGCRLFLGIPSRETLRVKQCKQSIQQQGQVCHQNVEQQKYACCIRLFSYFRPCWSVKIATR